MSALKGPQEADSRTDAPPPMLWRAVTDEDGDHGTVGVPEHDDEHRPRAAKLILHLIEPDWIGWSNHEDECIATIAPLLKPCSLSEHLTHPWHDHEVGVCGTEEQIEDAVTNSTEAETLACKREEGGCGGCEEGWICEEGDGPAYPYFTITRQALDEALEAVRIAHIGDDDDD